MTDWWPGLRWIAVEGCRCRGFFVEAPLLGGRLPHLGAGRRADLAATVQRARIAGRAGPGEILVSGEAAERARGTGIALAERGSEPLRGLPGRRRLFTLS